jgi:hypothetical protein
LGSAGCSLAQARANRGRRHRGYVVVRGSTFARKGWPEFLQYIDERPELISRGEKPKKAKATNKRKNKKQVIFTCLESINESKQRKQIDK